MRFDVITLFPELFAPMLTHGITRRAFNVDPRGDEVVPQVDVHLNNPRDHADGTYRRIDDRPFGGGPGMVMMAEPLARCLAHVQSQRVAEPNCAPVVLFSPVGQVMNHVRVSEWANSTGAVLICGRYEGIDQRFIDRHVTHQISLGDFVLSGGEIAALALLDAVARLQPGVLSDSESHNQDSFNPALDGLLDCPHYTRPEVWAGVAVPPVLQSGHHAHIDAWRRQQRLALTARARPDLIAHARLAGRLGAEDEAFLAQIGL